MDIQKEREAFQKFCEENFDFEHHEQTYFDEQTQCYENDIGEDTESINMAWMAWQAAKAQAVPKGYAVVPVEPKQETIKQMNKVWFESNCAHIMKTKTAELLYKAMIEAQEQSHE